MRTNRAHQAHARPILAARMARTPPFGDYLLVFFYLFYVGLLCYFLMGQVKLLNLHRWIVINGLD